MPYILTEFDNVPLPVAMPEDDLSTGMVESSLLDSIGGVYNYFGPAQRLPRRHQFAHRGKYEGDVTYRIIDTNFFRVTSDGLVRVTASMALADLHGKTNDLKAKIGVWGQLWRKRLADDEMTWKWCRLLKVNHVEVIENANMVSEVESIYETADVGWRSEDPVVTSESASDGVGASLNVSNSGTIQVRDAILRVERTSGTITQVTITGIGIDITWTGSIGSGETLVIDDGAQTVQIGSNDEYDGFVLGAGHTVDGWLPLDIGVNTLTVTVTGGNADVSVEHYNQWP
jgi:hypothetical protein